MSVIPGDEGVNGDGRWAFLPASRVGGAYSWDYGGTYASSRHWVA
jgi:hypothetical protein